MMTQDISKLLLIGFSCLALLGLFLYMCSSSLFSSVKSFVLSMKAVTAVILLIMLRRSEASVNMLAFFVLLSGLFGLIAILASFIMNKINFEKGDLDLDKNPELKN